MDQYPRLKANYIVSVRLCPRDYCVRGDGIRCLVIRYWRSCLFSRTRRRGAYGVLCVAGTRVVFCSRLLESCRHIGSRGQMDQIVSWTDETVDARASLIFHFITAHVVGSLRGHRELHRCLNYLRGNGPLFVCKIRYSGVKLTREKERHHTTSYKQRRN